MKVTGIIAEYNPFHNGHQYHIEQTKRLTGADYIIVVMSGNFTQRGAPAFVDKYTRTRMALACGADLVLELPLYYATGSAEYFAFGAVSLLHSLGIVDSVCFGSECGNIEALQHVAAVLCEEPDIYKDLLQTALKSGKSYPAARYTALAQYMAGDADAQIVERLLTSPNNILGIEYCKALLKLNSHMKPYTLRREGGAYNDASLTAVNSSALSIRSTLAEADTMAVIQHQMPEAAYAILQNVYHKSAPMLPSDMSVLLHYQLLLHAQEGYTQFMDVSGELSNRIGSSLRYYKGFDSFCALLKTKEITYTRVSRALLHILLGMTKEHMASYVRSANSFSEGCATDAGLSEDCGGFLSYARMLGFRMESTKLLSAIKQYADRHPACAPPLISKLADAGHLLSDKAMAMLAEDIRAAHIYNAAVQEKFGCMLPNEYVAEVIRM